MDTDFHGWKTINKIPHPCFIRVHLWLNLPRLARDDRLAAIAQLRMRRTEIGDDEVRRIVGMNVVKNQALRDLVQNVEREREEKDVLHSKIGLGHGWTRIFTDGKPFLKFPIRVSSVFICG